MSVIRKLQRPGWIRVMRANTCFERFGMCDNSLEVFDTDTDSKLLFDSELLKV